MYILILLYFSSNYYHIVFYFLLLIFFYGLFLSLYQLDFFVGFLWLTECLVVFVSVLLLFYLNNSGNFNKIKSSLLRFFTVGGISGLFTIGFNFIYISECEAYLPIELNFIDTWDDLYESISNLILNDAAGLFISYYVFNSLEFVLIGVFLLIGSLIVVNLHKFSKNSQYPKYNDFLEIFHFFRNWIEFFFMRKQSLTDQEMIQASTKSFGRK